VLDLWHSGVTDRVATDLQMRCGPILFIKRRQLF